MSQALLTPTLPSDMDASLAKETSRLLAPRARSAAPLSLRVVGALSGRDAADSGATCRPVPLLGSVSGFDGDLRTDYACGDNAYGDRRSRHSSCPDQSFEVYNLL